MKVLNFKSFLSFTRLFSLILLTFSLNSLADGGMFPVNQLDIKMLKKAGLKIAVNEIYNPDSFSLLHTIVHLGGCTGSFVSEEGLILTNHHCIFGSLRALSTPDNNLMEKGFLAKDKTHELPMKGAKVRIMLTYEDVSKRVLENVADEKDPIKRRNLINMNMESVLMEEKIANPDMEIDLSEMLSGRSYIVFRYAFLNDIRMVYVPQREIGEFGGETDNWAWPRHSGDFAFIRAYAGADGSPAEYHPDNVPYKPMRHLNVNAGGVNEGDFIFILGYPGRTFRNRPAAFINYMENVQMPFIADFFEYMISEYDRVIKADPEMKFRYDHTKKGLANTSKNYRGKLQSLRRIRLYENRVAEEQEIRNLLTVHEAKADEYDRILNEINSYYNKVIGLGPKMFWYGQLYSRVHSMNIARNLVLCANDLSLLDSKSEAYQKTLEEYKKRIKNMIANTDKINEHKFLKKLLEMAADFNNPVAGLQEFLSSTASNNPESFIALAYDNSAFSDEMIDRLLKNPSRILSSKNLFIRLYIAIEEGQETSFENQRIWMHSIDALLPDFIDLKMLATGETFIPDANSTLRLTFGYIRGYYPSDGVYNHPFTRLEGIPEKVQLGGDYYHLPELTSAIDNARVSRYFDEKLNSVPVNFIYNADTTGGNSGSPVLNAEGEIVGLNFDRAFEATVNDFAWNEAYSRSIGVDIRYILFITSEIGGASHLLKEMNAL